MTTPPGMRPADNPSGDGWPARFDPGAAHPATGPGDGLYAGCHR